MRFLFSIFLLFVLSNPAFSFSISDKCDSLLDGRAGCIIVADLRTGDVIAESGDSASLNGNHPPGSLFKIVSSLAALDENIVEWDKESFCDNIFESKGNTYKCSLANGHGTLDLSGALKLSCNHYFYNLVLAGINCEMLAKHAENLYLSANRPFGKKLGKAILPDSKCDPLVAVIGQPPTAITPYHALVLDFIIALEGENIPGKIIVNDEGRVVVPYKKSDLKKVRSALVKTQNGISYGGKTGTPNDPGGIGTNAWFIGWAPFEKPKFAVVVFLKKGFGQKDAEPLAREVFVELLSGDN
jgi:cell division protein FtsI/penicillin-binding protein 2